MPPPFLPAANISNRNRLITACRSLAQVKELGALISSCPSVALDLSATFESCVSAPSLNEKPSHSSQILARCCHPAAARDVAVQHSHQHQPAQPRNRLVQRAAHTGSLPSLHVSLQLTPAAFASASSGSLRRRPIDSAPPAAGACRRPFRSSSSRWFCACCWFRHSRRRFLLLKCCLALISTLSSASSTLPPTA